MKELLKKLFGIRNPAKNDEDIHLIEIDEEKELYLCCPLLNIECSKEECYINGGECFHTLKEEYSQENLLSHQVIIRPYEDYEFAEIVDNLRNENKRLIKKLSEKEKNINLEEK